MAEMENTPSTIILFLVVIIMVGIAATVLINIQDTQDTEGLTMQNFSAIIAANSTNSLGLSNCQAGTGASSVIWANNGSNLLDAAAQEWVYNGGGNNSIWIEINGTFNITSSYDDRCSTAYNATGDGLTGIGNFADLMPVLGTILAAVLIIGAIIGV